MLINKITPGSVIQTYDIEKNVFTVQKFVAGYECTWKTMEGETLLRTPIILTPIEPVLNFDMVQPKPTTVRSTATLDTFKVGDQVMVMPSDEPNDEVTNEFCGQVVNVDDMYYTVQDQQGNCFDCWPTQVYGVD